MTRSYALVLAAAWCCYAALGAVLRILPDHVGDDLHGGAAAVGLAVGAPALTAVVLRPAGGWAADRVGPRTIVLGGAVLMACGVAPAFVDGLPALDFSRLLVGAGEGALMAATVLWLLRLAGPAHRGRALGHIGLANYAGLATGPLMADALGGDPTRVFAAAVVLPLAAALLVLTQPVPPAAAAEPARGAAGHRPSRAAAAHGERTPHEPARGLLRATLRPGIGLALVNVGYVAVIAFGTTVARGNGVAAATLVVPVFAVTVIAARLLAAGVPDRFGAAPTLRVCVAAEGVGLAVLAVAHASVPALGALVVLSAGQALAVPALGLLALRGVPAERHGAAAGLFFSWFDAGVGLGGPAVGAVVGATSAPGAMALAGASVASVAVLVAPPALRTRPSGSRAPALDRRGAG